MGTFITGTPQERLHIVDYRSTFEYMLFVLGLGKDKYGHKIDIDNFDRESVKKLIQLYDEILENDVCLRFNPISGRVERLARSVRLIICELRKQIEWQEIARGFPSGVFIPGLKDFTASETCKRGETNHQAMYRCVNEEFAELWKNLGFSPTFAELISNLGAVEYDRHESAVYAGLFSIVRFERFIYFPGLDQPEHTLGDKIFFVKDRDGKPDPGTPESPDDKWVKVYLRAKPTLITGT